MNKTCRSVGLLLLLGLACNRSGPTPDAELASAAQFVRTFYAWYVPAAQAGTGLQSAMRDSTALFTPSLVRALEADGEAQAKNPDEVVGLDGDPFLDAQDFCPPYQVGSARRDAGAVLVELRGNCPGRTDSMPDVLAEVHGSAGAWVFTNFRYPTRDSDLMKDLDELRRARETPPRN